MEVVKKVERVLAGTFHDPDQIHLEDNDGIIGWVVSKQFRGLETIDRINIIWNALDQALSQEERRRVVTIVAVTPEEEIAHRARRPPARSRPKGNSRAKSRQGGRP